MECSDTDTVVVNINALPDIDAIANDYLILERASTQLLASGAGVGGVYDWEPPVGLDDPTIYNPIASIDDPTRYVVRVEKIRTVVLIPHQCILMSPPLLCFRME